MAREPLVTAEQIAHAIDDFGLSYLVYEGVLEDVEDYRIVAAAQSARHFMEDIERYVQEGL